MIINHNMSALFAQRQEGLVTRDIAKNIEKLSSAERINRAGDDASGLAVSEKMRSQIRGLNQAATNVENGISFIQVSEAFLQETTDVMQRLRELSVQGANGIYSAEDRMYIQVEVSQLVAEVDRIASSAQFNGMNLLTGRFARDSAEGDMFFHIGANMDQRMKAFIGTMTGIALGIRGIDQVNENSIVSVATAESANQTIGIVDSALLVINKQRADLGAYQNRLEKTYEGVTIASENLQAAESRIRDANMAKEIVDFTKNSVLMQSTNAMLAQANTKSQAVLRLLR